MLSIPWTLGLAVTLGAILVGAWFLWTIVIGAAWQPTPGSRVRVMLEMAQLKSDDVLYDLGSGDGRTLIEAAETYGARGVGVEADPLRVLWSRARISSRRAGGKIKVVWGDFFKQDLSGASVVSVFLWPATNKKLERKLTEELREGSRVVSYTWPFEGWEPQGFDPVARVYLYVIGKTRPGGQATALTPPNAKATTAWGGRSSAMSSATEEEKGEKRRPSGMATGH